MLQNISPENLLFLDIETVPGYPSYDKVPENLRKLWDKKATYLKKDDQTAEEFYQRAGIYAEFGKIICISCGLLHTTEGKRTLRIKSFYGHDEKKILEEFTLLLEGLSGRKNLFLCAHNGKEFDFPYLARRMVVNRLNLPVILDTSGKKPWETSFIDTLELWKFGDYKHYTSLELLTTILDIANPKDDIDGSMVSGFYYEKDDLGTIVHYCEKDVIAIAQLVLRYRGEELVNAENIVIVND
ncbi:MAG: ribonuclease H-like domain-containing protein [Bacteroidales bacterium]|nr:ribonuclease H-like domain-containing protein [Bacteroidales bacterium]